MALGSFASAGITAASGGDLGDALFSATITAASAFAFHGVGEFFESVALPFEPVQKSIAHGIVGGTFSELSGGRFLDGFLGAGVAQAASPWITPDTIGTVQGRVAAAAVVGGVAAELGGGKFANGAKTFTLMQMFTEAADYYERAVGHNANPLPGKNQQPSDYVFNRKTGQQFADTWDQNVIGINEPLNGAWYAPGNFFKQGGMLSRTLNLVPAVNATAGLHDYWFNVPQPQGLEFTLVNNVGTMLPAAAISMGASIGNLTQGWPNNPMALYLLTRSFDSERR